jgi:hypothetical protein
MHQFFESLARRLADAFAVDERVGLDRVVRHSCRRGLDFCDRSLATGVAILSALLIFGIAFRFWRGRVWFPG